MANDGSNGWSSAQRYLGVVLAALTLLGIVAGSVYAWSDVQFTLRDACNRIEALEDRQETAEMNSHRIERKVDRLLIEQGINPDDVR